MFNRPHIRRPCVCHRVGERFGDVNVVNRMPPNGVGRVMVLAGMSYGQRTQFKFIDGNLNAQRYHDKILRPIVILFIRRHYLMFQHDNAWPHVVVHNSWKLKMPQFFHGLHTHQTCHPLSVFGILWIYVYDSMFQFLPISSNFAQTLKRNGTTFPRS